MAHDHDHADHSELSEIERRVRALETVLTQKGYIDPIRLAILPERLTLSATEGSRPHRVRLSYTPTERQQTRPNVSIYSPNFH
jgi:hypothetical protein